MVSLSPWPGTAGSRAQDAHFPAVAVDDNVLRAVLAAQQLIVGLFHTRFTDHIARLVIGVARVVQHIVAHLAHVADQVGGKSVAGIKAALFIDGFQLRQLVAVRLDEFHFIGRDVLL